MPKVNLMKCILVLLTFLSSLPAFAQATKYVLMPDNGSGTKRFRTSAFTLNTYDLYKVPHQIKTFNFIQDNGGDQVSRLIYISALPDLASGAIWEELTDTAAINNLVSIESLFLDLFVPVTGFSSSQLIPNKFYNEYRLVTKTDTGYSMAKRCLLETFRITNLSTIFPTVYGSINLSDSLVSIKQYRAEYKEAFNQSEPQLGLQSVRADPNYQLGWRLWKMYLSERIPYGDAFAYKFWTATVDNSTGPRSYDNGVSRFLFVPNIGIVGGSYDFYFDSYTGIAKELNAGKIAPNKLSTEEWNNNILDEKIMIAEELEGSFAHTSL